MTFFSFLQFKSSLKSKEEVCGKKLTMKALDFQSAVVLFPAAGAFTILIFFLMRKKGPKLRADLPHGTVLLHQVPRGPFAPNMSPFPLKVETFLRINKIPTENDFKDPMGPKGKCPWMQYKGEVIPDSQFCIEHLKEDLKINMDEHLTPEQKSVSRAFLKLIEDSLLWLLASSRWQRSAHKVAQHWKSFPSFVIKYIIPRSIAKYTWAQGTGRHTEEEQFKIFVADIRAISDYLADKPYLMGGKVSEIDCSLFGMMIQFTYHDFEGKFNDYIEKNCENVKDYVERMKQEFWSDWPL